jgi:site-specific recombinase
MYLDRNIRISMVRIHRSSQVTFRSILTRYGGRNATDDRGVSYIGLGDQFDDDRRLVRETDRPLPAVLADSKIKARLIKLGATSRASSGGLLEGCG